MADLNQPQTVCGCLFLIALARTDSADGLFMIFFLELEKLNEARAATGFACHLPKVGLRLLLSRT